MQAQFQLGEEAVSLDIRSEGDGWQVRLPDGSERHIRVRSLPDDLVEISVEGAGASRRVLRLPAVRDGQTVEIAWAGQTYRFTPASTRPGSRGGKRPASGVLTAPMVGVVSDVLAQPGEQVAAYQPLALIEAMKVIATIEAPFAGTVKAVHVKKGDRIDHGAPVAEIIPAG